MTLIQAKNSQHYYYTSSGRHIIKNLFRWWFWI